MLKMESIVWNSLWSSSNTSTRVHLMSWDHVCQSTRDGDLGIFSLIIRGDVIIAKHTVRYFFVVG